MERGIKLKCVDARREERGREEGENIVRTRNYEGGRGNGMVGREGIAKS